VTEPATIDDHYRPSLKAAWFSWRGAAGRRAFEESPDASTTGISGRRPERSL